MWNWDVRRTTKEVSKSKQGTSQDGRGGGRDSKVFQKGGARMKISKGVDQIGTERKWARKPREVIDGEKRRKTEDTGERQRKRERVVRKFASFGTTHGKV